GLDAVLVRLGDLVLAAAADVLGLGDRPKVLVLQLGAFRLELGAAGLQLGCAVAAVHRRALGGLRRAGGRRGLVSGMLGSCPRLCSLLVAHAFLSIKSMTCRQSSGEKMHMGMRAAKSSGARG